jgi:hypothetical protein
MSRSLCLCATEGQRVRSKAVPRDFSIKVRKSTKLI